MAFRLLIDRARRVLVVRFGTAITEESIVAMRAAVGAFVARQPGHRAVLDFTAVQEARVTSGFIAGLARGAPIVKNELRILVAPKPEIFGLSRMYEMNQDATAEVTRVVRTLAEAYALLGVESLDLEELAGT